MAKTKTSATVEDRWNSQNDEDIRIRVPKNQKVVIQAAAEKAGQSINGYVTQAVEERIERDNEVEEQQL